MQKSSESSALPLTMQKGNKLRMKEIAKHFKLVCTKNALSCQKSKSLTLKLNRLSKDDLLLMSKVIRNGDSQKNEELDKSKKTKILCTRYPEEGSKSKRSLYLLRKTEIFQEIARLIKTSVDLRILELSNLHLTTEILETLSDALRMASSLSQLSLTGSNLSDENLAILSPGLSNCKTLNLLNLSFNKLSTKAGTIIGRIISTQGQAKDELIWSLGLRGERPEDDLNVKGLCEVVLQGNLLDDVAAKDICTFLQFDTWLRSLNLRNNKIEKNGIIEFIRILEQNTSILSLDLRDNGGFNRKASEIILEALRSNMQKFKECNNLKDEVEADEITPDQQLSIDSPDLSHVKNNTDMNDSKVTTKLSHKQKEIDCMHCRTLEQELLKKESRIVNLCIENAKLRNALQTDKNSFRAFNNSQSKIDFINPIDLDNLIRTSGGKERNVLSRMEYFMSELTRLMEVRGDKTIPPGDHLSNNSSNVYNNTIDYDMGNSGTNPINFNSVEDIARIDEETLLEGALVLDTDEEN